MQQSFFVILLNGSILHFVCFSNSSYGLLAKSFPATTEEPTCCGGGNSGRLFRKKTRTIIPVNPIGSLRVYVHPWLGTVPFLFLATLVAVTRIRASVSTPPRLYEE